MHLHGYSIYVGEGVRGVEATVHGARARAGAASAAVVDATPSGAPFAPLGPAANLQTRKCEISKLRFVISY
jgi:hypothetical protein